jgi:hypothetical protein
MRQTHVAGERLFVDYAGDGDPVVINRLNGEVRMGCRDNRSVVYSASSRSTLKPATISSKSSKSATAVDRRSSPPSFP